MFFRFVLHLIWELLKEILVIIGVFIFMTIVIMGIIAAMGIIGLAMSNFISGFIPITRIDECIAVGMLSILIVGFLSTIIRGIHDFIVFVKKEWEMFSLND